MYEKTEHEIELVDFYHPFGGKMSADNRWVKMARLIPWETLEEKYAAQFKALGRRAKKVRMAIGAILIQQKFGYSDLETVIQIIENPYLQYFLGLCEYQEKQPFDASMMVYFRKRVTPEMLDEINKALIGLDKPKPKKKNDDNNGPKKNKGKLIVDATCAPADIKYPTDLNLLNEAREKLEVMIETACTDGEKPRTYKRIARRDYLRAAKNKKLSDRKRRQAIRKQLNYVKRDLHLLEKMNLQDRLNKRQTVQLETIRTLYAQQKEMYELETNSVKERIVSISQPHVRPIVRGKAGAGTEFGAKLSISVLDGYVWVDKISWDNFNEGSLLIEQIEAYKIRHGVYPKAVIGDKIYCTRENRAYCKARNIRLSGPALGRPSNDPIDRLKSKRQEKLDTGIRNMVEGAFGLTKRKFSLNLIMTKLRETSETAIRLNFTLLNLERRLRLLLRQFLSDVLNCKINPFRADFGLI